MTGTKHTAGTVLKDTLGRKNRKLADRDCPNCGSSFRPHSKGSKYCSRRCAWDNNKGNGNRKDSPIWWTNQRGYIEGCVWVDGKRVRKKQHRWVMEQHLKRGLLPDEDVHHINGVKTDNRVENLQVIRHGDHSRLTNSTRVMPKGYSLNLSDEDRKKRSDQMKRMHAEGRMFPNDRLRCSKQAEGKQP